MSYGLSKNSRSTLQCMNISCISTLSKLLRKKTCGTLCCYYIVSSVHSRSPTAQGMYVCMYGWRYGWRRYGWRYMEVCMEVCMEAYLPPKQVQKALVALYKPEVRQSPSGLGILHTGQLKEKSVCMYGAMENNRR